MAKAKKTARKAFEKKVLSMAVTARPKVFSELKKAKKTVRKVAKKSAKAKVQPKGKGR